MAEAGAAPAHWSARLNARVADSAVGRWFRLEGSGHPLERKGSRFVTEIRAGLVTAAAMLYIIAVNSSILSDTGGPCECDRITDPACENDPAYAICVNELRRDYVTATSAISTIVTFLMGALANLPLGVSSGLGVNAYLAYTVVGFHGTGPVPYGSALGAVFLEGLIFFFLSLFGLRQWIGRLLPRSLNLAVGAGIGLFLCFVGIGPNGLGAIGRGSADLVGLGGCLPQYQDDTGVCTSHVLQDPHMWLGLFLGGVLTAFLLVYRVKGAFLWPILLVAIASWPRGSSKVTMFPYTDEGDSNFNFFKNVATWHSFTKIGPKNMNFDYGSGQVWLAILSLIYVDILDSTGTMFSLSRTAGLFDERSASFEGADVAFLVDSICISAGSLMGLSPCTPFIESAAGVAVGGKTGITAITTAFIFFLSLFFSPIFSNIPSYATGCTLILVGSLMAANTAHINWHHPKDAIPAFIAIAVIPFSFSIAYGMIAAIVVWILLHNVPLVLNWGSRGYIPLPQGWDEAEPYSVSGLLAAARIDDPNAGFLLSVISPWMRRLIQGKRDWWNASDAERESYLEGRRLTYERAQARKLEQQAEWREQRAAMRRINEVGQPASMPAHFVQYADDSKAPSHGDGESDRAEKRAEEGTDAPQLRYD